MYYYLLKAMNSELFLDPMHEKLLVSQREVAPLSMDIIA